MLQHWKYDMTNGFHFPTFIWINDNIRFTEISLQLWGRRYVHWLATIFQPILDFWTIPTFWPSRNSCNASCNALILVMRLSMFTSFYLTFDKIVATDLWHFFGHCQVDGRLSSLFGRLRFNNFVRKINSLEIIQIYLDDEWSEVITESN